MEKKNTVVRGIAIGVAVGAAVTMLKKENREKLVSNVRKAKTKMIEIGENPSPLKERVMDGVQSVKDGVQTVGVKGRETVGEIKKLTPAVMETLKEKRDMFKKKPEQTEAQLEAAAGAVEAEPIAIQDVPEGSIEEGYELIDTHSGEAQTEEIVAEQQDEPQSEDATQETDEQKQTF